MESKPPVTIDYDNVPIIIRDTMTSKDLSKIKSIDVKKGIHQGVIQLLNLIPFAGGAAVGEIELALDVRDANFFRNYISYLYGLNDTTEKEREDFIKDVEQTANDYSGNVLAGMISRIDNINKGVILSNLTRAKMKGEITIEDFFRIVAVVERIPYADFKYLPQFTQKNYIPGGVSELLLSAGVLSQTGIDANVDHDWLELSPIGTKLMKYGLGMDVELKDRAKIDIPALQWENLDDDEKEGDDDSTQFKYDSWRGK